MKKESVELRVLKAVDILSTGRSKPPDYDKLVNYFPDQAQLTIVPAIKKLKDLQVLNVAKKEVTISGECPESLPKDAIDFIAFWNNQKQFGS